MTIPLWLFALLIGVPALVCYLVLCSVIWDAVQPRLERWLWRRLTRHPEGDNQG